MCPETSRREYQFLIVMGLASGLALLTLTAFWQVVSSEFLLFDDADYVVNNDMVNGGVSCGGIVRAFAAISNANWHPLTWISHMLDVTMFGMWAGGHHLTNLLFHLADTLLLFGLLRQLTGRVWLGAFAAALFAVHPLHVESVAWVSERKDVLSTFFWLLTMWGYVRYVRHPSVPRYLAAVGLFALGLMSKPMLVTLPIVLLMLDWWPLDRLQGTWRSVRERLLEKAPFFVLAVLSGLITLKAQQTAIMPLEHVDISSRLANALISYGRYARDMFWPAQLAAYYPLQESVSWGLAALMLAILVTVTWTVLGPLRKQRYLAVGWLWYAVTLVPVIGVIQVGAQSHADRYTYVPLIGLFIAMTWGMAALAGERLWRRAAIVAVAIAAIAACWHVTRRQVGYWKDTYSLAARAVAVTPVNCRMLSLLAACQIEADEIPIAIENLRKAYEIKPHDFETVSTLGLAMLRSGRNEEALRFCEEAIGARPEVMQNWVNAALAYQNLGRMDKAREYLRKAMEIAPTNPDVQRYYRMASDSAL